MTTSLLFDVSSQRRYRFVAPQIDCAVNYRTVPLNPGRCFLWVDSKWNIIVAGGTSSGKTTALNAMLKHVDHGERIVT
ncbi:ATPase, T2SS/T4P/T4SS family, partial [uncultured Ruegeria sp.]|uniref:ATPase, T2SS/T4P/T4SS family n=1 Tax=uncultured Ruegeria sp. TaxID=259304 RepID=UPI00344CFE02